MDILGYIFVLLLGLGAGSLLLRFPPTKLLAPIKGFLNEQGDGAPHYIFAVALLLLAFIVFVILEPREEPVGGEKTATTTISSRLQNKSPQEKATLKGQEIAKIATTFKERARHGKADYEIEIVEIQAIEGGVEVFARAWNPDGSQIGFGDGTVDLERFRIFNPPVLVEDPNGTVIRDRYDERGRIVGQMTYREDTKEALMRALALIISEKQEKHDSAKIVPGKRGNTTSTFYSDTADVGPSIPNQATWSAARNAASVAATVTANPRFVAAAERETAGSTFNVARGVFPFETSAVPDTDTVTAVTLTFTKAGGENPQTAGVTLATLATPPTYQATEFDGAITLNSPAEGTNSRVDTNVANESTFSFSFNATGISWVSKTGWSVFCIRYTGDIDDTTPPNSTRRYTTVYHADETGSTKDPVLIVEHSGAATGATPGDIIYY